MLKGIPLLGLLDRLWSLLPGILLVNASRSGCCKMIHILNLTIPKTTWLQNDHHLPWPTPGKSVRIRRSLGSLMNWAIHALYWIARKGTQSTSSYPIFDRVIHIRHCIYFSRRTIRNFSNSSVRFWTWTDLIMDIHINILAVSSTIGLCLEGLPTEFLRASRHSFSSSTILLRQNFACSWARGSSSGSLSQEPHNSSWSWLLITTDSGPNNCSCWAEGDMTVEAVGVLFVWLIWDLTLFSWAGMFLPTSVSSSDELA